MKIRTGFVSNSSSTSFVVTAKTSMEVFNKMVSVIKADYCDNGGDFRKAWYDVQKPKVDGFLKRYPKNYNNGIIIPFTCNFETYIFPSIGGKCLVETCNNCQWDDAFPEAIYEDNNYKQAEDDETKFVVVGSPGEFTAREYYNFPYNYQLPVYEENIPDDAEHKIYEKIKIKLNDRIKKIKNNPDAIRKIKAKDIQDAYTKGLIRGCEISMQHVKEVVLGDG